jgi:hypothetical protein
LSIWPISIFTNFQVVEKTWKRFEKRQNVNFH